MPRAIRLLISFSTILCATGFCGAVPKPGPDVLVVADNFGHDASQLRPTPSHPIRYMILTGQQKDLGTLVAGEKMPTPAELETLIHRTLAEQGFTRTQVGGPMADIIVVYTYGSAYLDIDESSEEAEDPETGEITTSTTRTVNNEREILALIGAAKVRRQDLPTEVVHEMNHDIQTGRLYFTVSGFDAPSLRTKKNQMLWRTRISVSSFGTWLPDAMDVMLATAGPFFGIDSETPIVLGDKDRRKTEVKIGESTVVDEP